MSRYGASYTLSRLLLGCSFSLINKRCYHRQVKIFQNNEGSYFKKILYLRGELVIGAYIGCGEFYYIAYIVGDQQLAVCWDPKSKYVSIISKTGVGDVDITPEKIASGFYWDWEYGGLFCDQDNQLFLDYDEKGFWSDELNLNVYTNSIWELFKILLEKYKDADIGHILDKINNV